jgi:DNA polymerase III gamma/tau subunit
MIAVESLLTKYRPKTFKEVIGQAPIVRSLEAAIKSKAGKAFLFVGPSGTGKTTLARIVSDRLGCGKDIVEVDAASATGIDDMRQVTASAVYRPMDGAVGRGYIIDEMHMLSKAAVTSLLKSLEEAPWAYWFLCTTEEGKVPAAVKTRCLKYELKPVKDKELVEWLSEISLEEGNNSTKYTGILDLCAKEANGSPRQALANLGVCLGVQTREEAAELLKSAAESTETINFVRALYRGVSWKELQRLLAGMDGQNAESVRQVVRAYGTKVVLGAKDEKTAGRACEVLDAFREPMIYASDGITPVILACARLKLS